MGTWASINYPTSGIKCCRNAGSPLTVTPSPNPVALPHWHYPLPQLKGAQIYIFCWYVLQRCLSPLISTFTTNIQFWHSFLPSSKYVHPRGVPPCASHPFTHFGAIFSCQIFGTKIGKYSIFPRPEEVLHKLVWIYFHYFQFCFAMWINYIIPLYAWC